MCLINIKQTKENIKQKNPLHCTACKTLVIHDDKAHLVEREAGGRHTDQDVEEVRHQLSLRVLRQWEDRGGGAGADHPHLTLPQAIELVKGLPAAFR